MFLQPEAGAFGNHRKGNTKVTPKIGKYVYYTFTTNICSARSPIQLVVFCKHVLIL